MAVNMRAFSAARFCENPARSTSTFSRAGTFGWSTKPRQASQGMPSAGQGAAQPARATMPMQWSPSS